MRKFVGFMVVAMAALCLAGTAWSYDLNEHVTYGTNNKGDVLIFPVNVAFPNWDTKLVVINTSNEYSVVAKVVVRSPYISKELLDFLIYLSPTDVWVGYLQYGENGAEMYSEDGSVLNGSGVFASPEDPMQQPLLDTICDMNELVYVEVIEAWACGATYDGVDLGMPIVPKASIKAAYENAPWLVDDVEVCSFLEPTQNVLTGHYEVGYVRNGLQISAADLPTYLKDYDVNTRLTIAVETRLGEGNAQNNLCEVEAVLSKDKLAKYYYANDSPIVTLHWEVFPTKYTQINPDCTIIGVLSPYFNQNMVTSGTFEWCIEYGLRYYDLEEKTPSVEFIYSPIPEEEKRFFCWEINVVVPNNPPWDFMYDEGWAEYFFDDLTSCTALAHVDDDPATVDVDESNWQWLNFTGVPEIPVVWLLKFGDLDVSFDIFTPAWDDGIVQYLDGWCGDYLFDVPNYHVWEGSIGYGCFGDALVSAE
jgi:hypothetical protein